MNLWKGLLPDYRRNYFVTGKWACTWDFESLIFSWEGQPEDFQNFYFSLPVKNNQPTPTKTRSNSGLSQRLDQVASLSKILQMYISSWASPCASALAPVQPRPVLSTNLLVHNVPWVCGNMGVIADSLNISVCLSLRVLILIGPGKIPSTCMLMHTYKIFMLRLASQCSWDPS